VRVLLPGALILLITAVLCGGALVAAGRGTDTISLIGQQGEIWRTTASGLDNLSLAQESVGLRDQCIREAAAAEPDTEWLDENVGARMFDLFNVHETYILDSEDRPVYASVGRFVSLARGETRRPGGRSNL